MSQSIKQYALSNAQLNILDTELFYSGTAVNIVGGVCLFDNEITEIQLVNALNKLMKNNDWLRTRIGGDSKLPYRYVCDYVVEDFELLDFSNISTDEMQTALENANKAPIDIWNSPLVSIKLIETANKLGYWFKAHHLICDAANMYRIAAEVSAYVRGEDFAVPVSNKMREITPRMHEKALNYWRNHEIAGMESGRVSTTIEAERKEFYLPIDLCDQIKAYATVAQFPPSVLIEGAFYTALSVLLDKDTLPIGLMYLDENSAFVDGLFGSRASVVPTVAKINLNAPIAEYCEDILDAHMTAYPRYDG